MHTRRYRPWLTASRKVTRCTVASLDVPRLPARTSWISSLKAFSVPSCAATSADNSSNVRLTATPLRGYRDVQRHIRQCPIYRDVCHAMLARGILLSQRGIQGCLSTPMTEVEVEAFVQALDGALASVESR